MQFSELHIQIDWLGKKLSYNSGAKAVHKKKKKKVVGGSSFQ